MIGKVPHWIKKDKVKHYIRIKTHNNIVLRFWDKSGIKGLICVTLMSYTYEPQSLVNYYNHNPTNFCIIETGV